MRSKLNKVLIAAIGATVLLFILYVIWILHWPIFRIMEDISWQLTQMIMDYFGVG